MLKERAVAAQNANSDIKVESFASFASKAKSEGFTQFSHNLVPKNGGTPNIRFIDPNSGESVLVNLSKTVSKQLEEKKIGLADLFKMSIVDGANANGEARYYLARTVSEVFDIDEVITTAQKATIKVSLAEALKSAGAGALVA